jgi:hypothetical protein
MRKSFQFTLRRSLVIGLGPREENETTNGAVSSFVSMLFIIVAVGSLEGYHNESRK